MKRILASIMVLSILSIGLVGSAEEAKVEKKTTVETPGGTSTMTQSMQVKKTGDNPPK